MNGESFTSFFCPLLVIANADRVHPYSFFLLLLLANISPPPSSGQIPLISFFAREKWANYREVGGTHSVTYPRNREWGNSLIAIQVL